MTIVKKRNKTTLKLFILLVAVISLNVVVICHMITQDKSTSPDNSMKATDIESEIPTTASSTSYINKEWLINTDFSSGISPWKNVVEGDTTDIEAKYSGGAANYILNGSKGRTEISETLSDTYWTETINPEWPTLPDNSRIDSSGCYVDHIWDENVNQTRNTPSVHWKRDINMDRDMSDYNITSVFLEVYFNASVVVGPSAVWNDINEAIDRKGDTNLNSYNVGDKAKIYVMFQDGNSINQPTTVAINRTEDNNLGQDIGNIDEIDTGLMNVDSESKLRSTLMDAFQINPFTFTIYLGIDIYCEDSVSGADEDRWNYIIINTFNLTFEYEKLIDEDTSLTWYQIGEMLNHTSEAYYTNVKIDDVSLNFDYSINQSWPEVADDCRFEILVNNRTQTKYPDIKLIFYNFTENEGKFIEARSGGYELSELVLSEENISLSIRVFIADYFTFDGKINISIDNIYFRISYTVFHNPPSPAAAAAAGDDDDDKTKVVTEPWVNLLIAIAAIVGGSCLGAYLVAYQLYLKYPVPVRKIRKYRKTLKKKVSPALEIMSRKEAVMSEYLKHDVLKKLKFKEPSTIQKDKFLTQKETGK